VLNIVPRQVASNGTPVPAAPVWETMISAGDGEIVAVHHVIGTGIGFALARPIWSMPPPTMGWAWQQEGIIGENGGIVAGFDPSIAWPAAWTRSNRS
jgi:hypothetical protein